PLRPGRRGAGRGDRGDLAGRAEGALRGLRRGPADRAAPRRTTACRTEREGFAMSDVKPAQQEPKDAPARSIRRWPLLLLTLGVPVLAAAGSGVCLAVAPTLPAVPSVRLEGADPEVAEAITKARAAVAEDRRSAKAWGTFAMTLHAHSYHQEAAVAYAAAAK